MSQHLFFKQRFFLFFHIPFSAPPMVLAQMINETNRKAYVNKAIKRIQDNFMDGVNFDFEARIAKSNKKQRDAYTATVKDVYDRLKAMSPYYQVNCIVIVLLFLFNLLVLLFLLLHYLVKLVLIFTYSFSLQRTQKWNKWLM